MQHICSHISTNDNVIPFILARGAFCNYAQRMYKSGAVGNNFLIHSVIKDLPHMY